MAVTSIWPIKGRVSDVIKYARNPEKTKAESYEAAAKMHAVEEVIEYAADEMKTEMRMFVTGINCTEEKAIEQFNQLLDKQGRGARVCYHGYQSFAAEEVDAQTAHEIGVQLARNLWEQNYRVLVATHCNTGHYHNHFVICATGLDGRKFDNNREDYYAMRHESDRLCEEYGLSVIYHPEGKGQSYAEKMAERNGEYTVRGGIREAIDVAIKGSTNFRDFLDALDQMGYIVDQSGKYAKIKHIGSPRFVRFNSLGAGYDLEDIYARLAEVYDPEYPDIPEQDSPQKIFEGEKVKVGNMGYNTSYRCFVRAITITMDRPAQNRYVYFLMREQHRQLESYMVQSRILAEHHIETSTELLAFKGQTKEKLDALIQTRNDLRNAQKRAERAGDGSLLRKIRFNIDLASQQIKDCRDELKACDAIAERSGMIKEKLEIIEQEKFRGKENVNDEHISGSGRSGREDSPQRN